MEIQLQVNWAGSGSLPKLQSSVGAGMELSRGSTGVKFVPRLLHLAVSHLKFSLYLTRDQCLATGFAFGFLTTWHISSSIMRTTNKSEQYGRQTFEI